ncbi:MAG: DUF4339 domain-containing protein [Lachnospiraceae bacterium]|nr:DUF4339 domain-containing protein [Lachnospiraceae bacterium]
MNLHLEENEKVLISSGSILWISDKGRKLEDFVLTDKGLYCCYKEKAGLFAKPEEMIYRFEITDIVTDEMASHIEQVKIKEQRCLQIEFLHGMEHFSFQRAPKKKLDEFLACFRSLLGVPDLTTLQKERSRERLSDLAGDVLDSVGTLIDAGSKVLYEKIERMTEPEKKIEDRYYLVIGGSKTGPLSLSEMMRLAESGQIDRRTPAWTRGMAEWRPLEEIGGLRKIAESIPPEYKQK